MLFVMIILKMTAKSTTLVQITKSHGSPEANCNIFKTKRVD
jgi:hypothetical protein